MCYTLSTREPEKGTAIPCQRLGHFWRLWLFGFSRARGIHHYLIVKTENRAIIHHQRDEAGVMTTRIIRDGTLRLDPPGIDLTDLFPPAT